MLLVLNVIIILIAIIACFKNVSVLTLISNKFTIIIYIIIVDIIVLTKKVSIFFSQLLPINQNGNILELLESANKLATITENKIAYWLLIIATD